MRCQPCYALFIKGKLTKYEEIQQSGGVQCMNCFVLYPWDEKPAPSVAHFTPTHAMKNLARAVAPRVQVNMPLSSLAQVDTAEANFREIFRMYAEHPDEPFYQAAMDGAITVLFSSIREGK